MRPTSAGWALLTLWLAAGTAAGETAPHGPYLGAAAGAGRTAAQSLDLGSLARGRAALSTRLEGTVVAGRLYGGYRWRNGLGVEAAVTRLLRPLSHRLRLNGQPIRGSRGTLRSQALLVTGTWALPDVRAVSPGLKVGGHFWEARTRSPIVELTRGFRGFGWTAGAWAQWRPKGWPVAVRADYDYLAGWGPADTHLLSLGVVLEW